MEEASASVDPTSSTPAAGLAALRSRRPPRAAAPCHDYYRPGAESSTASGPSAASAAAGRRRRGSTDGRGRRPRASAADRRRGSSRIRRRSRRSRRVRDGSRRFAPPVIAVVRCASPRRHAPSRLSATFMVTNGRRVRMVEKRRVQPRRLALTPTRRRRRASRRWPSPGRDERIRILIRRRRPPDAGVDDRGAHGPVRPVWLHGSSVQYSVAPRAAIPASASAWTSACGRPPAGCPVPTTTPSSSTTTAPTIGLGLVRPRPRSARASARAMWCRRGVGSSTTTSLRTARRRIPRARTESGRRCLRRRRRSGSAA